MNNSTNNCPCEAVKELQKIVSEHDKQLGKGCTQFAVINTKLNIITGILSAVGLAVCTVLIRYILPL